jgi:isoamylase
MTQEDWQQGYVRCLGVRLAGDRIEEKDHLGNAIQDDTFLILINAHHEAIDFTLPEHPSGIQWQLVLDTTQDVIPAHIPPTAEGNRYELQGRSLVVLHRYEDSCPLEGFAQFMPPLMRRNLSLRGFTNPGQA